MANNNVPAKLFDLSKWKLQIPGPREVKNLNDYSSDYFSLTSENDLHFHLDSSEKGTTPHAHFVRSELRHLVIWKTEESRYLAGEFKIVSKVNPDKMTFMQIHGILENGKDAPPLLRIAINNGDLIAALKSDSEGKKTDMIILKPLVKLDYIKVEIRLKNKELKIFVDDQLKLNRNLNFWNYLNYFKVGCYPQATSGVVDVFLRNLKVE